MLRRRLLGSRCGCAGALYRRRGVCGSGLPRRRVSRCRTAGKEELVCAKSQPGESENGPGDFSLLVPLHGVENKRLANWQSKRESFFSSERRGVIRRDVEGVRDVRMGKA